MCRAARRRAASSAAAAAAAAMIAKFYSNHNQRLVLLGTLVGLGLSAVPFAFKDVRRVEQRVQQRALGACAVAGRARSRSALGAAAEAPARARARADANADWPRALLLTPFHAIQPPATHVPCMPLLRCAASPTRRPAQRAPRRGARPRRDAQLAAEHQEPIARCSAACAGRVGAPSVCGSRMGVWVGGGGL